MLSRTADNLFWLARYVERAEYISRAIEATLRATALPTAYAGATNEWDSALLTSGVRDLFMRHHGEADERSVVEFLLKRQELGIRNHGELGLAFVVNDLGMELAHGVSDKLRAGG